LGGALQLNYRPPYDWAGLLTFLGRRALKGVEVVRAGTYMRTVRWNGRPAWIRIVHDSQACALRIESAPVDTHAQSDLTQRLRALFDLDARPDEISAALRKDKLLADTVTRNPGLRVAGAFDGFELAIRAILGQQITVKAATTIGGRFSEAFGEKIGTPHAGLTHLTPAAERVAGASIEEIASLGIVRTRARSIIAVASECALGRLHLEPGADPQATIQQLLALPGIGPWTAQYIAMRALRMPDAFPKEDIALRNRLGGMSAARAEQRSIVWRPYRSYATLHLWSLPEPAS
jgi:AraC family transcriptional regulator of adaptative response / DNA-3-methyladenine glycosylase II